MPLQNINNISSDTYFQNLKEGNYFCYNSNRKLKFRDVVVLGLQFKEVCFKSKENALKGLHEFSRIVEKKKINSEKQCLIVRIKNIVFDLILNIYQFKEVKTSAALAQEFIYDLRIFILTEELKKFNKPPLPQIQNIKTSHRASSPLLIDPQKKPAVTTSNRSQSHIVPRSTGSGIKKNPLKSYQDSIKNNEPYECSDMNKGIVLVGFYKEFPDTLKERKYEQNPQLLENHYIRIFERISGVSHEDLIFKRACNTIITDVITNACDAYIERLISWLQRTPLFTLDCLIISISILVEKEKDSSINAILLLLNIFLDRPEPPFEKIKNALEFLINYPTTSTDRILKFIDESMKKTNFDEKTLNDWYEICQNSQRRAAADQIIDKLDDYSKNR